MNMSMSNAPVLTGAGNNAAMDADVLVKADEDWINKKWRPVMGWMYMVVCMMDFVIFPILWSLLQAFTHGNVTSQWQPVTLQGAGLFHISMGAVLGIAAYGRTKEKVAGAN
jgi:ABC-type sugar transport system permease subunit